jgi:hypothetical protein
MNDTNTTNGQSAANLTSRVNNLKLKIAATNEEIEANGKKQKNTLNTLESDIDTTIGGIEKDITDLDAVEKKSEEELDELMLERAEELAEEAEEVEE